MADDLKTQQGSVADVIQRMKIGDDHAFVVDVTRHAEANRYDETEMFDKARDATHGVVSKAISRVKQRHVEREYRTTMANFVTTDKRVMAACIATRER